MDVVGEGFLNARETDFNKIYLKWNDWGGRGWRLVISNKSEEYSNFHSSSENVENVVLHVE